MKKDPIRERLPQNQALPKWAEDFPVDAKADGHVARRDFIRFLCLVSLGLFTGQAGDFSRLMGHGSFYTPVDHTLVSVI